jgi:hypothetical protein
VDEAASWFHPWRHPSSSCVHFIRPHEWEWGSRLGFPPTSALNWITLLAANAYLITATSERRSSDRTEGVESTSGQSLHPAGMNYNQRSGNPDSPCAAVHFAFVVLADVCTFPHPSPFRFTLRSRCAIPLPLARFWRVWQRPSCTPRRSLSHLGNRCALVPSFAIHLRSVWHLEFGGELRESFYCKHLSVFSFELNSGEWLSRTAECRFWGKFGCLLTKKMNAMQNPSQIGVLLLRIPELLEELRSIGLKIRSVSWQLTCNLRIENCHIAAWDYCTTTLQKNGTSSFPIWNFQNFR